jgi:type VI secretion system protein ImpA
MATIAINDFLQPLSEESPCGDNLEYDAAFAALERAAAGEPERVSGDKTIAAVEPKWPDVADAARELLGRTRDLRVVMHLTRAAVTMEGVAGLAAGLKLAEGLLQSFWDFVHPQLDKDDNNDPTQRINSLAALNDRARLVRSLGRTTLVISPVAGRFSLRSVRLSKGEGAPEADEKVPDAALVDAAFLDCDLDALQATAGAVAESLAALESIGSFIRDRVEVGAPSFENLENELKEIRTLLAPQLLRRGVGVDAQAQTGADGGGRAAGPAAVVGEIRTRDDAVRMLDNISDYFRKNEPSSPVPILLQRAKRLVSMDFMEILRDLTPNGVEQAQIIAGSGDQASS